ncbi:MAG: hypothetical protein LBT16_00680 [Treponema sp.]|jgi:hypothetical protein|nr:hypothetical protein [Treponema sp.]
MEKEHQHSGDHDHEHHDHGHGAPDLAKITTLLGYMLSHNNEHAGEIAEIAHLLRHADKDGAADLLEESVKDFDTGNEKLSQALALLKGGA